MTRPLPICPTVEPKQRRDYAVIFTGLPTLKREAFSRGWEFGGHLKILGFLSGSDSKKFACNAGDPGFDPWVRKIPWRREWQPTPVFLPGKSHGQRNWLATVHEVTESYVTEQLTL